MWIRVHYCDVIILNTHDIVPVIILAIPIEIIILHNTFSNDFIIREGIVCLKELSQGSPHTQRKIDNDIHNVLCQQLARRQDLAGPYVVS